jgi:hypothetical protein
MRSFQDEEKERRRETGNIVIVFIFENMEECIARSG